jgi:hypothetical protein
MRTQCIKFKQCEAEMDLMEGIFIFAVLDGPVLALLYFLWRRFKHETK